MTINEIIEGVNRFKPCSLASAKRYLRTLGIRAKGALQRPAQYPDDAVGKIKTHLGFDQGTNGNHQEGKIGGLKKLRDIRNGRKLATTRGAK